MAFVFVFLFLYVYVLCVSLNACSVHNWMISVEKCQSAIELKVPLIEVDIADEKKTNAIRTQVVIKQTDSTFKIRNLRIKSIYVS